MPDKFSAVWVSHSSIGDFQKCPRAYYLKNVYRNPDTRHKMTIMSPALALGGTVHEVIEALSNLPTNTRFNESLLSKFNVIWDKVSGKKGGFTSPEQEARYKQRGEEMLRRVSEHPGPLKNLAVKIKMDLPHYWLSEEDGIILCGKVDWLEYLPDSDMVNIIDFKTGKGAEREDSLQLPIYALLVANCQKRKTNKVCYWYIDRDNEVCDMPLPNLEDAHMKVLLAAKEIKLARKLERYKCHNGEEGCMHCKPFEKIIAGEAEFVGVNEYSADVYVMRDGVDIEEDSIIL